MCGALAAAVSKLSAGAQVFVSPLAQAPTGSRLRAAREYLLSLGREVAVRFDVIGLWNEAGLEKHLLVRGAFVSER